MKSWISRRLSKVNQVPSRAIQLHFTARGMKNKTYPYVLLAYILAALAFIGGHQALAIAGAVLATTGALIAAIALVVRARKTSA